MNELTAQDSERRGTGATASDIIYAVRGELQGRTSDAVVQILRTKFERSHIDISEGELQRVANDISRSHVLLRPTQASVEAR